MICFAVLFIYKGADIPIKFLFSCIQFEHSKWLLIAMWRFYAKPCHFCPRGGGVFVLILGDLHMASLSNTIQATIISACSLIQWHIFKEKAYIFWLSFFMKEVAQIYFTQTDVSLLHLPAWAWHDTVGNSVGLTIIWFER